MISSLSLSVSVDLLMYLSIIRVGSVLLVLVRGKKGKSPGLHMFMSGLNLSFVLGFMLGFGTNDNVTV